MENRQPTAQRAPLANSKNAPSPFGAHPLDAQPAQMRAMSPPEATFSPDAAAQLKEEVSPDAIPDAHVAYEHIARLSYQDQAAIRTNPNTVQFLTKLGYDAARAQIIEGEEGFAMLHLPCMEGTGKPPIVAFRGTQPTELADLLADVDLNYIGEPQFTANREVIQALLESCEEPAILLGHSLGGALAQKASLEFAGMTQEVVTFQAPGLGLSEKGDVKDREEEEIPDATHHIAKWDLVDRAGLFHTPGEVFIHDSTIRPVSAHTSHLFATDQFADERDAFDIGTEQNGKGEEVDSTFGHEIRETEPGEKTIEQNEDYPGFRRFTGLGLETLRSVVGFTKEVGAAAKGAAKAVGNGVKGIGSGIGRGIRKLFSGDNKPARRRRRMGRR